jgi:hypothetical protein
VPAIITVCRYLANNHEEYVKCMSAMDLLSTFVDALPKEQDSSAHGGASGDQGRNNAADRCGYKKP